jgi:hypothetical protein
MDQVKDLILLQHSKDRHSHSDAGKKDFLYEQHKYSVFIQNLKAYHVYEGVKVKGSELIPPGPEQRDKLVTMVIDSCVTCQRLRREKRQEAEKKAKAAAQLKNDFAGRYAHRLMNDEYESDPDHDADDKCGTCGHKAGRRGQNGIPYSTDRDRL